jgi:hypothetical protein
MKNKVKRAAFVIGDLVRCISEEEHLWGLIGVVLEVNKERYSTTYSNILNSSLTLLDEDGEIHWFNMEIIRKVSE